MNKIKTVYIVGPMTGLPNANRAAFHEAQRVAQMRFERVISPANEPDGLHYENYYMRISQLRVDAADALIVLDGWENSHGALREILHATLQNKPCLKLTLPASSNEPLITEIDPSSSFYKILPELRKCECGGEPILWRDGIKEELHITCDSCRQDLSIALRFKNGSRNLAVFYGAMFAVSTSWNNFNQYNKGIIHA